MAFTSFRSGCVQPLVCLALTPVLWAACDDLPRGVAPFDERVEVAVGTAPTRGPAGAPVTLVEFGDYQCPYCGQVNPVLSQVLARYPDDLRQAYKQFPLTFHGYARAASEAALFAAGQGKFWDFHDRLYANQDHLRRDDLLAHAKAVGLDSAKLDSALADGSYTAAVDADVAQGKQVVLTGTPTFFVNGRRMVGYFTLEIFEDVIDEELEHLR